MLKRRMVFSISDVFVKSKHGINKLKFVCWSRKVANYSFFSEKGCTFAAEKSTK